MKLVIRFISAAVLALAIGLGAGYLMWGERVRLTTSGSGPSTNSMR
jgi:hypothetical protein